MKLLTLFNKLLELLAIQSRPPQQFRFTGVRGQCVCHTVWSTAVEFIGGLQFKLETPLFHFIIILLQMNRANYK
jgi:hypothetical protein